MDRRTIVSSFIITLGLFVSLFFIARSPATTTAALPLNQADRALGGLSDIQNKENPLPVNDLPMLIYFSVVLDDWLPPCGSIPILINPADGSTATSSTIFRFDGQGPDPNSDWVELEFNTLEDFTGTGISYYFQPASLWEISLADIDVAGYLTPGAWYWRTSLWCNGSGWPPPPTGYEHSPFTEVWSFTLEN